MALSTLVIRTIGRERALDSGQRPLPVGERDHTVMLIDTAGATGSENHRRVTSRSSHVTPAGS